MDNWQSKALSVGAWFFGVFFIIGALGVVFEGNILAAILMFVGGSLLLPPVKRLILDRKPKLGKGKITAAGSVLAVIGMFLIPTDDPINAEEPTSNPVATDTKADVLKPKPTIQIPEYKIIEDTVKRDVKRTVEVELSSRMDEASLKVLAEKIYALSDVKVERTFIIYRIAGEGDGSGWATTHYNPDLKIDIIGASASDYEKIKNASISEGEVLGSWMVSRGMDYKATVYKKDGQIYMREVYDIGALPEDKTYKLTKLDKGIKLQSESGKSFDEYFVVNQKGDLEFWSEDKNYYTAPKFSDISPELTAIKSKDISPKQAVVKSEDVVLEKSQDMSRPQKNAVRSAKQYISMTGFSRDGLIEQLSSEYGDGYDVTDATIAVDSLNVNWNEQAAKSAEEYLNMTGFSCNGLIEQLSSSAGSKYTTSEATYGAQQAGACS